MAHSLLRPSLLVCSLMLSLTCCASRPQVQRVGVETVIDLSGKWNDVDARSTSDALIHECFGGEWLSRFTRAESRPPAVRVRHIANRTDEHIDAEVFIKSIERAMVNSGKVRVLAQEGDETAAMDSEQARAASGRQRADTPVQPHGETGADFVIAVRLGAVLDQIEGEHVKLYQVNFELISATTSEKVWIGEHRIKKHVKQDGVRW